MCKVCVKPLCMCASMHVIKKLEIMLRKIYHACILDIIVRYFSCMYYYLFRGNM
jgi:hypothetical protein